MGELDAFLKENQDDALQRLVSLLRIPSVSASSTHRGDVRAAANWVADRLGQMSLAPEVIETPGNPLVYAETPAVPGAPVALVYGHYDVQPPEPLDLWTSPPFEPTVRSGNLYARGATDDKGQMLTHLEGAAAVLATQGRLPLQLKFLIEGEEEIGSPSLGPFIAENREKLACDVVVISDSGQFAPGVPAITYGLRGIAYYEVILTGPSRDLHSGSFGGAVTNPANTLTKLLAGLTDSEGRIQLPGFYDTVTPLTDQEREEFRNLPFDESHFQQQLGVDGLSGEAGYTTLERRWARPTCDINGLWSGYQGEGAKTVLPSSAGAKVSFRLVPRQTPEQVGQSLERYLRERLPPGIRMTFIDHHGGPGVLFPLGSPAMQAASRAIEHAFGRAPVFIREGGSIPIVADFAHQLDAQVLLLGWGQDDDNAHAPDEKFCVADFHRGIQASARLWNELATATTASGGA